MYLWKEHSMIPVPKMSYIRITDYNSDHYELSVEVDRTSRRKYIPRTSPFNVLIQKETDKKESRVGRACSTLLFYIMRMACNCVSHRKCGDPLDSLTYDRRYRYHRYTLTSPPLDDHETHELFCIVLNYTLQYPCRSGPRTSLHHCPNVS